MMGDSNQRSEKRKDGRPPKDAAAWDSLIEHHVVPALTVNDEALGTEAVLAGHVIGLMTNVASAAHIRAGRLVPLLVDHIADKSSVFVYDASRDAVPCREWVVLPSLSGW